MFSLYLLLALQCHNILNNDSKFSQQEQHSETSERLKEWRTSGDGCSGDEASSPIPSQGALLTSQLSDEADLGASALPHSLLVQDSSPGKYYLDLTTLKVASILLAMTINNLTHLW